MHCDSLSICKVTNTNKYILCTASKWSNCSWILYYELKAVDCIQHDNFIISGERDNIIRCYRLNTCQKYTFNRRKILNNLNGENIMAIWRYGQFMNNVFVNKQFKHMIFACDTESVEICIMANVS